MHHDSNQQVHSDEQARRAEAAAAPPAAAPATGSQPCITEPANCRTRILRKGVDSLYLTYKGILPERRYEQLKQLKELAQSDNEVLAAGAQLQLGEHLFEVRAHGRPRFPILLVDNWFDIGLSTAKSDHLPLAHVQISSELITAHGIEECTRHCTSVIQALEATATEPSISRLDLFVDFTSDLDFENIPRQHFVKRARTRAAYDEDDRYTGWIYAPGGDLSARLYNKSAEIRKSGKDYLQLLWAEMGWIPGETVWRLEFQIRREVLQQFSINSVPEVLLLSPFVWNTLMTEWLRLTLPSADDQTRSRWPTHPTWLELTHSFGMDPATLQRVRKARIPADKTLFKNGLWGLTSFMAREGITEFDEGIAEYLRAVERFHGNKNDSHKLEDYVTKKVRAKGRHYNTIFNAGKSHESDESTD